MKIKLVSILAAAVLFVGIGAMSVQAQTTTSASDTTYTTTSAGNSSSPGLPNTGAGGDAAKNLMILTSSVVGAITGAGYLMMRRLAVR